MVVIIYRVLDERVIPKVHFQWVCEYISYIISCTINLFTGYNDNGSPGG